MGNLDYKQFAERRRPHIQPPDEILFLTFRLAGSIPKSAVREYKARKEWLESQLRRVKAMAEVPSDDDQLLILIDDHPALAKIMHSLKGRSARECNLLLERTGPFWEHESFDHVIRSGKFDKTIRYVLNNPVKVGLVRNWEDWRWNYCRKELVDRFKGPKK